MRVGLFAVFGLVFGSFLTVVIHRVPRGESVITPRSRCPSCGTEIRARDNIPVVSWLFLRGRCRRCGTRISPEYPLVEAGTAALFGAAGAFVHPPFAAAVVAPFLGLMVAIGIIDARWRIVPNRIVYPAFLAWVGAILVGDLLNEGMELVRGLIGLAAYAVPLLGLALVSPRGMGMGDVKLAGLIGLVLGSLGLRFVAVAAGTGVIAGGLAAVAAVLFLGYGRRQHMPFGPFLAGGAVVAALAGNGIAQAYLSLLR